MADTVKHLELAEQLNGALGWEMRALALYSHYAAYVRGIHRLHLKPYFEAEATESLGHSNVVRNEIVKLGGIARTDRDETEIVHTTDYQVMLKEAMETERRAASTYREFLDIAGIDGELYDAIEQIYFAEERAVIELTQMI
jgi:bacterioferritin